MAKVALTFPHSSAAEEHVFSVIGKIEKDDRGKLKLEGTLSSLVSVKINLPVNNVVPGTWRPHANFLPDPFLINILKPNLFPVGVVMAKPNPLPCPHAFSNAHSDY